MSKKARVLVTIKKDVLDPAGSALKKVLLQQGLNDLLEVRVGKIIDIAFKHDIDHNLSSLEQISKDLLGNSIVEDVAIQLVEET